MIKCEECDKNLGILEGYRHPALGTSFLVCENCYYKVGERMEHWNKFCLSNLFNAETTKIDMQEAWNNSISNDLPLQLWFNALWIKKIRTRNR